MMAFFQAEARAYGFGVYPETCGVDLVLLVTDRVVERIEAVREYLLGVAQGEAPLHDHHSFDVLHLAHLQVGDTIALEGKLVGSVEVFAQALPPLIARYVDHAPAADFYGVIVPAASGDFERLAERLGIGLFEVAPERVPVHQYGNEVVPAAIELVRLDQTDRVLGFERLALPEVEVDMVAGHSAPRRVTPWMVAAVKACLIAQHRPLARADFRPPLTPESMVRFGWMTCQGRGASAGWTLTGFGLNRIEERDEGLVRGPLRPDISHPELVEALLRAGFNPKEQ